MKLKQWLSLVFLILGSCLIVIALTIVYSAYPSRNAIDQSIADYFYSHRGPVLSFIFFLITHLGEELVYIGIVVVLYYTWDKSKAYRIIVLVLSSTVVNGIFKYSFKLERPDKELWYKGAEETSPGLPSGHTQIGASFWGGFALFVKRWWFSILSTAIVLLIGFSRIILAVHWFTDVLMGLGIGLILLAIFNEFEEKISNFINSLNVLYKIVAVCIFFVFLLIPIIIVIPAHLIFNEEEVTPMLDMLKLLTLFATANLSYAVEGEIINFNSKTNKWWKYIIRVIIGLVMLFLFYFGLKELFKLLINAISWAGIEPTLDIIRYGILGPVLILLTPWIIKKFNV